jgi:hypothetical protein
MSAINHVWRCIANWLHFPVNSDIIPNPDLYSNREVLRLFSPAPRPCNMRGIRVLYIPSASLTLQREHTSESRPWMISPRSRRDDREEKHRPKKLGVPPDELPPYG